ncbi:MFS transporter [Kibdelosporangium phytohabitans]|uniref:MFS transporter n=1 Tax=Kibdelosporangium phytohabitans TaxID=860235 RepID=UPI0012FA4B0E|nr:MFS transporter [Kibdelosporangium phytohabitans]MBE1470765.1 MFS family permease [Kibdelosporangium phytohabitans]
MTAQLMVGVDATILALAIPGMTADLQLSTEAVAWVMAGYVLVAGALMIAGGRIAQAAGYARMMTLGLVTFGLASAVGGAADAGWILIGARLAQGVGAAAMTPAAMARLSAAFPGDDRAKAYGIFGMIMGSGTAIGLLFGGVLTQVSGWRACMYVNLVFVAISLVLSAFARDRVEPSPGHGRGWWGGVVLGVGVALVIQALTVVDTPGPAAALALAGIAVVGLFAATDRRAATPMIPVVLFQNATRRIAYYALFLWGIATIATFVAASGSLQREHHLAPLAVGALFLIYPAAVQIGLAIARRLCGTLSPVRSIGLGLALIGVGQAVLALSPDGVAAILAALGLMGLGTSQVMPNANSAMNQDAGPHAGVAGAVGTTLQQLGGSFGLAIPVAFAAWTTHAASVTALLLLSASLLALRQPQVTTTPIASTEPKEASA